MAAYECLLGPRTVPRALWVSLHVGQAGLGELPGPRLAAAFSLCQTSPPAARGR